MAVLDELPGFDVTVVIDGVPAKEYDEHEKDPPQIDGIPTCEKYIESKRGASFTIRLTATENINIASFGGGETHVLVHVLVDGEEADNKLFCMEDTPYSDVIEGVRRHSDVDGKEEMQPFQFASLKHVEDCTPEKTSEDVIRVNGLGTIKVVMVGAKNVKRQRRTRLRPELYGPSLASEAIEISEKALKGNSLSLHTMSSGTRLVDCATWWTVDETRDLGTLVFNYRTRSDLEANLVIPRPTVEDVNSMSLDELRDLSQRLLAEDNRGRGSSVKRARSMTPFRTLSRPLKIARTSDGKESIDLTEEED